MPLPPSNGKTVLITGINGYIASVLGALVISKGYYLRGTSRRLASTEALLTGPYAQYKERVKMFEVPDMTVDGAFHEAVNGVRGIFHTASPFNFTLDQFETTVVPAMRGSEVLLASALKAGPQLNSVVVTSSVVAIINPPPTSDHVYTEADFASASLDRTIKERDGGVKTPGTVLYQASKTAAEQRVWEFRNEHKPSFAISTVNPSAVIGPPVVLPTSGSKLNETLRLIYNILSGTATVLPPSLGSGSFVDVRDVAFIHLWALENPSKADGERYIACGGFGPSRAAADVLHEKCKDTKFAKKMVVGTPGEGYLGYDEEKGVVRRVEYLPGKIQISGKKAEREMGIIYTSFKKSVVDTAEVLEKLL